MTPQTAPPTVGTKLKDARKSTGLSLERAAIELTSKVPEHWRILSTSLHRIETGHIAHPDPITIAGLCEVYGVSMKSVDPEGAAALSEAKALIERHHRPTRAKRSTTWESANASSPHGTPRVAA